ncbi:MAG TPA: hypothetical protein PKC28_10875 [Bdellovibrionales bacterium]|nr:hypothetical protein [Bdellovibrionales bacterium]
MKILLIAWFDPNGINTVKEHLSAIKTYSKHEVTVLNTYRVRRRFRCFFNFQIGKYDSLIFHNTVTYNIAGLRDWDRYFQPRLSEFPGFKILMKQDEMRRVNATLDLLEEWRIGGLTTCLPDSERGKVYSPTRFPKLRVLATKTGYVTPEMKAFRAPSLNDRRLDVVYRGMPTPFEWGRLGYEKFEIAQSFKSHAQPLDLKLDISARFEDRLGGREWTDLLSSSRAALATESGASIFDFDGSIERRCQELRAKNPEVSFEQAYQEFLHPHDGLIKYNQISPRHIEAAYTRTAQVLYEGEYSGLIEADKDYISLKKDYSNFDQVIEKLRDDDLLKRMTQNAYTKLIENPDLTYPNFVRQLDELIETLS